MPSPAAEGEPQGRRTGLALRRKDLPFTFRSRTVQVQSRMPSPAAGEEPQGRRAGLALRRKDGPFTFRSRTAQVRRRR